MLPTIKRIEESCTRLGEKIIWFKKIQHNDYLLPIWIRAGEALYEAQQFEMAIDFYTRLFDLIDRNVPIVEEREYLIFKILLDDCRKAHHTLGQAEKVDYYDKYIDNPRLFWTD